MPWETRTRASSVPPTHKERATATHFSCTSRCAPDAHDVVVRDARLCQRSDVTYLRTELTSLACQQMTSVKCSRRLVTKCFQCKRPTHFLVYTTYLNFPKL